MLITAEIDLAAIDHNVRQLRGVTDRRARLMAVVKAHAYGHGAIPVARQAIASGAHALGVARIDEGIELRDAGVTVPILVLGATEGALARELAGHDLAQTVFSRTMAESLSAGLAGSDRPLRVHIKLDTGMGRIGLPMGGFPVIGTDSEALNDALAMARLPGLQAEGIYTHFSAADAADRRFTHRQLHLFLAACAQLEAAGLRLPLRHAANSAAVLDLPDAHLDMVRVGIAMYGLDPFLRPNPASAFLRPAMTLKTRVVQVKRVAAGIPVSYGGTYVTRAPTTLATVAGGYGDGLSRLLSSRGQMLIHGRRAPIVGRVCMDMCLLDVGHVPGVAEGDEAVIMGRQGDETIGAGEIAEVMDTIHYEVVTGISRRVTRTYRPADSSLPLAPGGIQA